MQDTALQPDNPTLCEIEAFKADLAAINQAFGSPICEGVAVEGESITMSMNPAQAKFLMNHLTTTLSLIGTGLKARLEDHTSNVRANQIIDSMVAEYSEDDHPVTLRDMLAKGRDEEMRGILSAVMMKAATSNLQKFCDSAAELAIDRARMDFQTTPVISLLHDVVEIGIAAHQKRSEEAENQPAEKELIGENIIRLVDFKKPRQSTASAVRPAAQETAAK
jgi:hypothetical protein